GWRHPLLVRPAAAAPLAALRGRHGGPRRGAWGLALLGEHRGLRWDVGAEAPPLHTPPDPLGGEARVGADRGEFGTGEAGAVEDRVEPVALVAVRLFTETGDHAACLRIDRHLAAVDQMRPLARFAAQLRVRISTRDRRLIRAPT